MTNKQTTTHKEATTPFYKKALFPWIIILVAAVYVAGAYTGWVARSEQVTMNDVTAAIAAAQPVKK